MKCTEANESEWTPCYNDGYDDGYFEKCIKAGMADAKFEDAYVAGYKQGHHDKYNPE